MRKKRALQGALYTGTVNQWLTRRLAQHPN